MYSIRIKTTKDSWYITDPELNLANGENIQYVGVGTTLKYLRAKISPWVGIYTTTLKGDIEVTVQKIRKLA